MQEVSTCPDRAALNRLAGGAASADEAHSLREHIENCPLCRNAAAQTVDQGHTLSAPPAGDDMTVAVDDIKEIGGYRVFRKIGQGGMGLVFEAEDVRLRRRVAIKVMRPTLAVDAVARERFLREARAVAAVQHDHVVPIFHVGEENSVPFLVMPLLAGESLDDRLQRVGRMPVDETVRVAAEAAAGLAAAHARGIVHRDVKPANIWLEDRGPGLPPRARLLDFGLARGGPGEDTLTIEGMVVGTPAYMSPEQALGQPVDASTDIYSLGAVLFRSLTGSLPTPGLAVPDSMTTPIPGELAELIRQMLDRDPAKRPGSARVIEDALGQIKVPSASPRRPVPVVAIAAGVSVVGAAVLAVLFVRGDLDRATPPGSENVGQSSRTISQDPTNNTITGSESPELLVALWARKHGGALHFRDGVTELVVRPNDPLPAEAMPLHGIELSGNKEFQSDELKVLAGLDRLAFITLDHSDLDNEGAKHLAGLTALDKLYLSDTHITNEGLKSLTGLKNLRVLKLSKNDISDDGLIHLRGLSALRELWLDSTKVSDAGLHHLYDLRELRVLSLMGTKVQQSARGELRKQLPKCELHIGPIVKRFKKDT